MDRNVCQQLEIVPLTVATMLFLAAFVRHTTKQLITTPLPYVPAQLLHSTAPLLRRKGAPTLSVDIQPGRELQSFRLFTRKFEEERFDDDIARHEFFEKGAVQRVRIRKEAKMRMVNRDFRERLLWCIKQRARYALLCVCVCVCVCGVLCVCRDSMSVVYA